MPDDIGFVKWRRGFVEHLRDGRVNDREFAAFTVLLAEADHRTAIWRGSGSTLGRTMRLGRRTGQRVLLSLRNNGYITECTVGYRINKYFAPDPSDASPQTHPHVTTDAPGTSTQAKRERNPQKHRKSTESTVVFHSEHETTASAQTHLAQKASVQTQRKGESASVVTPIQEVSLTRTKAQELNPGGTPSPVKRSSSSTERQRNVEARDRRLMTENDVRKELKIGARTMERVEMTDVERDERRRRLIDQVDLLLKIGKAAG